MQLAFDFGVEKRDPAADADSPRGERSIGRGRYGGFSARTDKFGDTYFFAILPDKATAAQIGPIAADLRRRYQLKGRSIATHRYHVSLHGSALLDQRPADLVARMRRAADTVSAASFALCFDQAMSFSGGAVVLLSSDEMPALNALHSTLGRAMIAAGLPVRHSLTPHLTISYDARVVPATEVPPIRWTAHDFILIRSLRGLSRYDPLGRWPLRQTRAST
jgi:2'-5' RNA ligase